MIAVRDGSHCSLTKLGLPTLDRVCNVSASGASTPKTAVQMNRRNVRGRCLIRTLKLTGIPAGALTFP